MSEFAWEPSSEYVQNANVTRFMRRLSIRDYGELVRRSQADPEWFWAEAIEDLDIEFFEPYSKILDASTALSGPTGSSGARSTSPTTAWIATPS